MYCFGKVLWSPIVLIVKSWSLLTPLDFQTIHHHIVSWGLLLSIYPASAKAVSKSERKLFSLPMQPIIVLAKLSYGKQDFEKVEDRKTKIERKELVILTHNLWGITNMLAMCVAQNRGYFDTENSLTFMDFEGLQIEGQAISNCRANEQRTRYGALLVGGTWKISSFWYIDVRSQRSDAQA